MPLNLNDIASLRFAERHGAGATLKSPSVRADAAERERGRERVPRATLRRRAVDLSPADRRATQNLYDLVRQKRVRLLGSTRQEVL